MQFIKSFDKVLRYKSIGHFSLTDLKSDTSLTSVNNAEIVEAIINTPFHFCNGEIARNGLTIYSSITELDKTTTSETINNVKIYGFFDATKLTASDYRLVERKRFENILIDAVHNLTDGDDPEYLKDIQKFVADYLKDDSFIYHLALDRETNSDKVSEWTNYDSFQGFLLIAKGANKVTLVEVGAD